MSLVPETIWAIDIKWDEASLGPKLNELGDDFEMVYNEEAVRQVIYLSIKDTDEAQGLINAHPLDVQKRLNQLKEIIEDKEWSIELGSIFMEVNYQTRQLMFEAAITGQSPKTIRLALDLTLED